MTILFARYSRDNYPTCLLNVIDTPEHLFYVLVSMKYELLRVNERNELVFTVNVIDKPRDYCLVLERAEISN